VLLPPALDSGVVLEPAVPLELPGDGFSPVSVVLGDVGLPPPVLDVVLPLVPLLPVVVPPVPGGCVPPVPVELGSVSPVVLPALSEATGFTPPFDAVTLASLRLSPLPPLLSEQP